MKYDDAWLTGVWQGVPGPQGQGQDQGLVMMMMAI